MIVQLFITTAVGMLRRENVVLRCYSLDSKKKIVDRIRSLYLLTVELVT
jgi:hypothetical protein